MLERLERYLPFALPRPHIMAFAPLDVWTRLLLVPPAWIPPRYWARLAFCLFTSSLGTVMTLPERVLLGPVLWWCGVRTGFTLGHKPGVVVVVGYPRSGTTHLHYLLTCDPRFLTPRWYQALAPQGFVLSWGVLRFFLIPFLSNTRPMDDMTFGPEWPAEDEFAVNNWSLASWLPGRLVLPRAYGFYRRFHNLVGLTAWERRRWRRHQWAFVWKVRLLAGRRRLLLKSPSHTARVRELMDVFTPLGVKFVHISREPEAVVRSNVAMLRRVESYHLQGALDEGELREGIVEELAATEEKYLAEAPLVPPGHLAEVRYQDLVADPMGELRRIYAELDLGWTAEVEERARVYLYSVRDYRAATTPSGIEGGTRTNAKGGVTVPSPRLAPIVERFGHNQPARARIDASPPKVLPPREGRINRGIVGAALTALVCAPMWILYAYLVGNRSDWMVWPVGALIGIVAVRTARVGSARLGVVAGVLALLALLVISFPATFLSEYYPRPVRDWEWKRDVWISTRVGLLARNNIFWLMMGMVSAYRFASRKQIHPPGRG